jgi:hypothetical protein
MFNNSNGFERVLDSPGPGVNATKEEVERWIANDPRYAMLSTNFNGVNGKELYEFTQRQLIKLCQSYDEGCSLYNTLHRQSSPVYSTSPTPPPPSCTNEQQVGQQHEQEASRDGL